MSYIDMHIHGPRSKRQVSIHLLYKRQNFLKVVVIMIDQFNIPR